MACVCYMFIVSEGDVGWIKPASFEICYENDLDVDFIMFFTVPICNPFPAVS